MKITPSPRIWALVLCLAAAARGDEVLLKNGLKLEGTVHEEGGKVRVDVGSGTIIVDRTDVQSISRPEKEIQEFDRRQGTLKPDDAEGAYQLALWARQNGLRSRSDRLMRSVLDINPNHEGARVSQGYIPYKGAWLTPDEHKAAIGLVRYQGSWMSSEAAERMRKIDQELAQSQLRQSSEERRLEQELILARQRLGAQQQYFDVLRDRGELREVMNGLGVTPWGMRYWGPAVGAQSGSAQ